jgi:MFS family permease
MSGPILSEFKSFSLLSYLGTAYMVSTAASQPISCRLRHIFGRGPGLILGNATFSTENLLCGLAANRGTIIFGWLIAGLGGGGFMSIPTFLASDLVPLRNRAMVGGIENLWYGAGAMVGAVMGVS